MKEKQRRILKKEAVFVKKSYFPIRKPRHNSAKKLTSEKRRCLYGLTLLREKEKATIPPVKEHAKV